MSDGIGVAAHEPALLFNVRNTELHGYIQRYPLLTGPDETLNRKCFCGADRQHRTPRTAAAPRSGVANAGTAH